MIENSKYYLSTIFEKDEKYVYGREPVLNRMPDKTFVSLVYSGGPSEPDFDNLVLIVKSFDDGKTWTKPEVLFKHPARPTWGTEIFAENGHHPLLFVHTYHPDCYFKEVKAHISVTKDSAKTWSGPYSIPGPFSNISVRKGFLLKDKTWAFPVYWQETAYDWEFEKDVINRNSDRNMKEPFRCGLMLSNDKGKSFNIYGRIMSNEYGLWEPTAAEWEDNHIIMLMRADFSGFLYRSDSFDGGKTWTNAERTNIENPGTKIALIRIKDKLILIHNPNKKERINLSLWVSDDGLKSFGKKIELLDKDDRIFYPHPYIDYEQEQLYIACDKASAHYLLKVPFDDFL